MTPLLQRRVIVLGARGRRSNVCQAGTKRQLLVAAANSAGASRGRRLPILRSGSGPNLAADAPRSSPRACTAEKPQSQQDAQPCLPLPALSKPWQDQQQQQHRTSQDARAQAWQRDEPG
jgi:hypothetical protein